jgi:hypothetical protein
VYSENGFVNFDDAWTGRDRYSEAAQIVAWKMPFSRGYAADTAGQPLK